MTADLQRLRASLGRVIEAQRVDYSKDPQAGHDYDVAAEDVIDDISALDVHTGNFHIALRDLLDRLDKAEAALNHIDHSERRTGHTEGER
jgi:hypothetical protein